MRRSVLFVLTALAVLLCVSALGEQVGLASIPAVVSLPEGAYKAILTPENLAEHETLIHAKGGSLTSWQEMFKAQGIQMMAFDDANQRVLVISALADADGQRLVDMDQQTADIRATYRREHLDKDGAMAQQGYRLESAEWKDFDHVGRFLMMKYRFSPGGDLQYRGFARRSVKNGLTITVDMRVQGRGLKAGDNTALNKVFDTLSFTAASAPGITLPVVLGEKQVPPEETNQPVVTLSGSGRPGTAVNVVVGAFTGGDAPIYNAIVDDKGEYKMDITLPREDSFLLTLRASMEGLEEYVRNYPVRYQKLLIPVTFTSQEFPAVLTQDSYTLSGKTDGGVSIQLIINGEQSATLRTPRSGAFSFKVNTKAEGTYAVRLSMEKKGLNSRTFEYTGTRGAGDAQTPAPVPGGSAAAQEPASSEPVSPNYTDLIAQAAQYDGKTLTYDGYLIKTEQQAGDWVLHMALRKTGSGYADTILLVTDRDPAIRLDSPIRVVGELIGLNLDQTEEQSTYPKLQLSSITAFPSDAALPTVQP